MASILQYFTKPKHYEPCPRVYPCAAPIGDRLYMWGGRTEDFSESGRKKLASVVEIYDPYLEAWQQEATTGVPPPGLFGGGCAAVHESLLWYGGHDGNSWFGTLHQLNTTTLNWEELHQCTPQGPMAKSGCGLSSFHGNKAALFGGYGIPTGPTQPRSTFTRDTRFSDGRGLTNEFHLFDLHESVWSSPPTTGSRPPPCAGFSFTAIDSHRGVLFGGYSPGRGRINDIHIINMQTMHWTKLDESGGRPWPVGRVDHVACCLNYGEEHPQLLVSGGWDNDNNTLKDLWVLDVETGTWKELAVSEDVQPRRSHMVTTFTLSPGLVEATMFGGSPKLVPGGSDQQQPKIARTIVLQFESVVIPTSDDGPSTREWVLVSVTKGDQLGSPERLREKIKMVRKQPKAASVATQTEHGGVDVERQTSQERERILQARITTHSQRATAAQERLVHRIDETERAAEEAIRRAQEAERRAAEAEKRLQMDNQPFWAVNREEIEFTGEKLGEGGWAEVKVAKFRGARFAAKCLYTHIISHYNRDLFIREMNMAARVRHPNLLLFIGATLQGELTILTELMPTSLRALLEQGELPRQQLISIACDIAKALNYLHLMRPDPIIHRDVSSANVLLDHDRDNSWKAKVSDYGSANFLRQLRTAGPGNPTYAAPEANIAAQQSSKMDIFSFGVVLVEMCTARFPDPATRECLILSIRVPRLVRLVRQCTAEDKDRRPSAADIITQLTEL